MPQDHSEDIFKVTDRRRRQDAEDQPVETPKDTKSPPQPGPPPTPSRDRSLAGLFMMLASSAVVALGHAPDPLTGQRQTDLVQAADAIELLVLLREKTEGNRSDEETRILDELIYDLQLRYVHVTKQT
jgi:Domain of unknown function (DUF1844)